VSELGTLGGPDSTAYDVNNNGQVSIGVHGLNVGYPDGSYAERQGILDALHQYTAGFLWFLASDPRVPSRIRSQMAPYGLCADEFTDTGNWPRLLYLREGRRLIGATVLVEPDVELTRTKPDTIAIASYAFDSHHVSRWIDGSNRVRVEGGFWNGRAAATRRRRRCRGGRHARIHAPDAGRPAAGPARVPGDFHFRLHRLLIQPGAYAAQ